MQQPPDFAAAGIVSSADNSGAALGLARGSLFTIYGKGLAPGTTQASGSDLVTALQGTRIRFVSSGVELDAPLWYVSPVQVNGVVPAALPLGSAAVSVINGAGASESRHVEIVDTRFTAFTTTGRSFGPAVIQQYTGSGVTLNRFTNAAAPGDALVIWGTGLGGKARDDVTVFVDHFPVAPFYAGPAPGLPGVDQINFLLPQGVMSRCFLPFLVRAGLNESGVYTVATGPGLCPIEFALAPSALEALDRGSAIQMTVLNILTEPSGDSRIQRAEAWVGEYDAAYLSVLANHDWDRSPVPVTCSRAGDSYDRWRVPVGMGLPAELYGLRRAPNALQVSITGPGGCAWAFSPSPDGTYRADGPARCPAGSYSIRDPQSIASASGRVPWSSGLPPMPSIQMDLVDAGAMVAWRDGPGARLSIELSSSFTLPGNIFNGQTERRELSCRLSGYFGSGVIPPADLQWALGLPSGRSAASRLALTSQIGGSWSSPNHALLIRTTEIVESALPLP